MNRTLSLLFLVFFLFSCREKGEQKVNQDLSFIPSDSALSAQEKNLYPLDHSKKSSSFLKEFNKLKQAVKQRDSELFKSLCHKDVFIGLGGSEGLEGLEDSWKLDEKGKDSELWKKLDEIVRLGVNLRVINKDSFMTIPYLAEATPSNLSGFDAMAIIGKGVRIRKSPHTSADVVGVLNYGYVKGSQFPHGEFPKKDTLGGFPGYWEKIKTEKGVKGYVFSQFIRSPIDFRLVFSKDDRGQWGLFSIVEGD